MSIARKILMGAAGAGSKSLYVDDVFSTYLYRGNETARSISNGVDNTKGGMVWIKNRDNGAFPPYVFDTERGVNKQLRTSSTAAETSSGNTITAFNNNGFSLGTETMINRNSDDQVSWNFRKAKGFFDVVSYTGNGSNRNIAHNLGCVPGMIIIKDLDDTDNWEVYHKSLPEFNGSDHYYLILSGTQAQQYGASRWNNTAPTASSFRLGQSSSINQNGSRYIAYVFAGGQSDAATARSVNFNGSSGYITVPNSSDLDPGSGDLTIDFWFKVAGGSSGYYFFSKGFGQQIAMSGQKLSCWFNDKDSYDGSYNVHLNSNTSVVQNQWNHAAVTRSGNTFRLFLNGTLEDTATVSFTVFGTSSYPTLIGAGNWGSYSSYLNGKISNFRYIKGQALYTTSFRPSNEPSTTTSQGATSSNVKLLCCNNSSVTGATVTPGTLTANSGTESRIYNPFQDPESFKFGEEEDQSIIKTGMYNGSAQEGTSIYLGFEPQWLMVKSTQSTSDWCIVDSMRGIVSGGVAITWGTDPFLEANTTNQEATGSQLFDLTSTGFTLEQGNTGFNVSGSNYVYIAIRRPDGYVGKPAEVGTDVFTMDTGNSSSTIPCFDSGFVVDYALSKLPASAQYWQSTSRLTGTGNIETNQGRSEESLANYVWDSNVGVHINYGSTHQAWMWKRHVGMDVVTYPGNGFAGRQISHSLNKTPEMIWVKERNGNRDWQVYHKGLNGGTNPEQYYLNLNTSSSEGDSTDRWNDTAPTSTHFTVGGVNFINHNFNNTYMAMLFASVDGISKVGYYTGTGSSLDITTGFQPRFLIVKRVDASQEWFTVDTTRGWGAGNDQYLTLNSTNAQASWNLGIPLSTGFTVDATGDGWNTSGGKYIYYAHA